VTNFGRLLEPRQGLAWVIALALAACGPWLQAPAAQAPQGQDPLQAPKFSGPSSQSLHQLFNDYWEWRLVQEPELATSVGRPHVNDRWRDLSRAARDRARGTRQEYLERSLIL